VDRASVTSRRWGGSILPDSRSAHSSSFLRCGARARPAEPTKTPGKLDMRRSLNMQKRRRGPVARGKGGQWAEENLSRRGNPEKSADKPMPEGGQ